MYKTACDGPARGRIYKRVEKEGAIGASFHLDAKKALQAYRSQKHNANRRGIGWELTFKEWCDFWGDDIDRRGRGGNQLGMQRILDSGPYKLGNIIKGHPRDNINTRWAVAGRRADATIVVPGMGKGAIDPLVDDDGMPDLGYNSVWRRIAA